MGNKVYIAFDSRAEYDEDQASIVEYMGGMSEKRAVKKFTSDWLDSGCVLFSYDQDGETLKNGQRVYL